MPDFPQKTKEDIVHTAVKATLEGIPFAGGTMATLFEHVFSAPIERRKERWFLRLSETVKDLLKKVDGLSEEKLAQNERFISATLHASQIAMRTHQLEKLKALQNALTNIALRGDEDEDLQSLHLRLIDELTPLHIKILAFQSDPKQHIGEIRTKNKSSTKLHYNSLAEAWNDICPAYPANSGPATMVAMDLYRRGLSRQESLHGGIKKISTKLGDEFLGYIREPSFNQKSI